MLKTKHWFRATISVRLLCLVVVLNLFDDVIIDLSRPLLVFYIFNHLGCSQTSAILGMSPSDPRRLQDIYVHIYIYIYMLWGCWPPHPPPPGRVGSDPPPPCGWWVVGFVWFSNVFFHFSYYTPHELHMVFPYGFRYCFFNVFLWWSVWFSNRFSYGFIMCFLCFPYVLLLDSYGILQFSLCFPHVFYVRDHQEAHHRKTVRT